MRIAAFYRVPERSCALRVRERGREGERMEVGRKIRKHAVKGYGGSARNDYVELHG